MHVGDILLSLESEGILDRGIYFTLQQATEGLPKELLQGAKLVVTSLHDTSV